MKSTNSLPFIQNIKYVLCENYLDFSGRASRGEYWKFALFLFCIYMTGFILSELFIPSYEDYVHLALAILFFIPSLSVQVRRLHDINRTGWWILIEVIPIIGTIITLYFAIKKGDPCENKYGPVPLYEHE